ncbi:uncharacterized protein PHALS_01416 [Plasmopara halstedii]|uniref:Uncharacterized protein n=1 Tax=Plasmopara halstedii TaxID=4781 RepID=A0A0P1AWH8_PLAHL|nr:uncharacterized protein PHALS_01416 [Plasmopara halstedii]CEG45092.1 hypothetical protein PHALS_01416 [Plasmopara halstedii]|eukprot:XP_024581461.1 hypothetical protein PHALS_01416 [Plasmopara halstedii]
MVGQSLLTQGLEDLGHKSKVIDNKLDELYARDDELQAAHQQAKRDDAFGEEVVIKYKAFLLCRDQLIFELERQKIQVPWQLRMTIDDLELTLMQRRKKDKVDSDLETREKKDGPKSLRPTQTSEESFSTAQSVRVMVAFVGPSLIAVMIAVFWYYYHI